MIRNSAARPFAAILVIGLAIVTGQRGLTSAVDARQAPDRSKAPEPGPPPSLKLPAIQKRTLSNGLPVWIVELHKVPVVHVDAGRQGGRGADPAGKFGLASLTADMLDEGAGHARRSADR